MASKWQLHREDGLAFEGVNGDRVWALDGNRFSSKKDWKKALIQPDKNVGR